MTATHPPSPPSGYHAIDHGLSPGVYCARAGDGSQIALAITHTVFRDLEWPLRSPFTAVLVSCWLDEPGTSLALIHDPMGDGLWRCASNSFGEVAYAADALPLSHPVFARLPDTLTRCPHRAVDNTLYLDIGSICQVPPEQPDATADPVPLTAGDRQALACLLSPDWQARQGWTVLPDGSVTDVEGQRVLPAGFMQAVDKAVR